MSVVGTLYAMIKTLITLTFIKFNIILLTKNPSKDAEDILVI